jgi:shikimate 5-dehydrogenase
MHLRNPKLIIIFLKKKLRCNSRNIKLAILAGHGGACMAVIPATQEAEAGGSQVQVQPRQSEPLSQNQNINKRTGEIVQVIDCLLECAKALGPIPSATKKRENSPF